MMCTVCTDNIGTECLLPMYCYWGNIIPVSVYFNENNN